MYFHKISILYYVVIKRIITNIKFIPNHSFLIICFSSFLKACFNKTEYLNQCNKLAQLIVLCNEILCYFVYGQYLPSDPEQKYLRSNFGVSIYFKGPICPRNAFTFIFNSFFIFSVLL
jgi:hypothetical protein